MSANLIERAELLIQQNKFKEAEYVLNGLMVNNPTNIHVLALLCEVKIQQNLTAEAEQLINSAISLSPDVDYLYYIKARIYIQKEKYDEAEKNLEQAISINPVDADYYAVWASIKVTRKQFAAGLELANKALEHDPENILGLNIRSTALFKLDQKEDSFHTIQGALNEDPNNAYTHANYGWSLLEKGDHKKSLEHFSEALKNNPNLDYAQAGMAEALKAKYLVYRWFLKYSFWIGNLTAKYQWGVIIGFYLGFKGLKALAANNETLQPYLIPLIILLALVAFSTWIITPIGNLFLRLNKYGKHLLNKKEIQSSNFVAISAVIFLAGCLLFLILHEERWLVVAAFGFTMMIPLSTMFLPSKYKNSFVYYTIGITLIGGLAIFNAFSTEQIFGLFATLYVFGIVGFQWVANFLVIRDSNR